MHFFSYGQRSIKTQRMLHMTKRAVNPHVNLPSKHHAAKMRRHLQVLLGYDQLDGLC